jgi:LacI family transcriptional regulator
MASKFDVIAIDNYQGSFEMTSHLIQERHYEDIAYICGPVDNQDAIARKDGFIDAMKLNGIKLNKSRVLSGNFTKQSGTLACQTLLRSRKRPQAIIAANDMMALGCYSAINDSGLEIPKDIAVAGFDDIFVSHLMNPGLTTVKVHIDKVGKFAAKTLIERMESPVPIKTKCIKIATELVKRKSC